ncbi:MAG TPA: type II toxin-antitoxin system VapC family toxin [Micropepsaceae bacterium]|nr:type II toxin-antitoxin system VapC family toxin [Micropepsaceae bacterium]
MTLLGTEIVLYARGGNDAVAILRELIERAGIAVVPFDGAMAEVALDAFTRYGKGRGHKAQLNILDCAAYALARSRNLPLLFKGNDFRETDIMPAVAQR